MSLCPKCGSKFESGKFRCSNCGAPLVYAPSPHKGPSLWARFKQYKNILILIALAIAIVALQAVMVIATIYWLIIGGLAAAVLVLWLRGRSQKRAYSQYRQQPPQQRRFGSNPNGTPNSTHNIRNISKTRGKHANVIPFKKKRSPKSKTKPD